MKTLKEKTPERTVFTTGEWYAVLSSEWNDPRYMLAVVLAGSAGLRIGEVRGLMVDALSEETFRTDGPDGKPLEVTEYVIDVKRNWQDGEWLKLPKTGWVRRANIERVSAVPFFTEPRRQESA